MSEDHVRSCFASARVARLATVSGGGQPHLVPITFGVIGDDIGTAIDHKPKTTTALRRLRNIGENGAVTLLVDHYAEDWSRLWWARADGDAEIVSARDYPDHVDVLVGKYSQYRAHRPDSTLILVHVTRWSGWAATA